MPVAILGASALATALAVRLTRHNWVIAGIWDADHERALVASLRIGCCAFPDPAEPLAQADWVLLGVPFDLTRLPDKATIVGLGEGLAPLGLWVGGGVEHPDQDLAKLFFRLSGERQKLLPLLEGLGLKEAPPGE